jgi:hypothetical protein
MDETAVAVGVGAGCVTTAVPPDPLHAARSDPNATIVATGARKAEDSARIDPRTAWRTTSSPCSKHGGH